MEENLLSLPTASAEEFTKSFKRRTCGYEDSCCKFKVKDRSYTRQYSHIYYTRLEQLRPRVENEAKNKWGEDFQCESSLTFLSEEKGKECCIVGTIFKQMELKPSILKEISAKNHLPPQPSRVKYISATDGLILEDTTQRIVLKWKEGLPAEELVTGVVMGLRGSENKKGEFEVTDVCYPELPKNKTRSEQDNKDGGDGGGGDDDKYVLMVSGLNVGSKWCDQLSIEMMVDYIAGQLGGANDQKMCCNIVRVIIAGNSITDKPIKSAISTKTNQSRFNTRNYSAESLEAMKELDNVLCQLSSCVPVDIMPGSHDPTNFQLPQQPMHRCMFPQANNKGNFRGVTNPYSALIDQISFLGSSGNNVDDIYRFTSINDRLRILENTLQWCHLAPTSPDTLACFPYKDEDPFIVDQCPDVYFAGNQPRFQKKKLQGDDGRSVLLICVPNFDLTHSCVLINLNSLDCQEVSFTTSLKTTPNPALQRQREIEMEFESGALSQPSLLEDEEMSILHHMDEDDNFDD